MWEHRDLLYGLLIRLLPILHEDVAFYRTHLPSAFFALHFSDCKNSWERVRECWRKPQFRNNSLFYENVMNVRSSIYCYLHSNTFVLYQNVSVDSSFLTCKIRKPKCSLQRRFVKYECAHVGNARNSRH